MFKKATIPILTIFLIFSCFKKSEGLKPEDMSSLVNHFLSNHAKYHSVDDSISEKILNNFINTLDYGKYFFYKKDIKSFKEHEHLIDDYIEQERFDIISELIETQIFNTYKKRFNSNMTRFNRLIKKNYNFSKDEKILVDRDKIPFPSTEKEMQERWRKNIKLQLLNYLSAGKNIKQAKTKLKNKYRLLEKRINEIDRPDLLSKFMNSFSTALDPHSNYLTKEQHEDFKISMELKLEGIGVRLRTEDGFVIVESIIQGGATDKLPENIILKPNDKIVAVAQANGEPVDVIDMDLRNVVKKIRGEKGTEVRLTVLRDQPGKTKAQRMIVPIIREEIKLQDSDAESDILELKRNSKAEKIGYIKLPSFYQDQNGGKSSAGDIKLQTNELIKKGITGLILDLRGNPGGLLNEAVEIAGLFIKHGPIVQIKDGRHPPQSYSDRDEGSFYDGPVVILIDKFSASASEILAGAIKDYKRGLILGPSNSYGKGTVQSYNVLPGGKGAIKITTHIFYQPGGSSNQLYGISPDIKIPDISSIWDIGEDKTRYPLKWKKIPGAYFRPYTLSNSWIVKHLRGKSSARIDSSSKFKKLKQKIKKFKKQISNKYISLKEESNIEKQKKKEIEKNMKKKKNKKTIDLNNDLFLEESFNVTADYIHSLRQKGLNK